MKRIAYASPVNPAPSGISDYSEELLPFLGQYAELTLYVDDDLRLTNQQLTRALPVRPLGKLEADQRKRPFDAIVYHMGNSPAHAAIWRAMQRVPGVVVLHDYVLHHFMLNHAAATGTVEQYAAEARARYGETGQRIAQLMLRGRFTAAAFDLPFNERVLDAAHAVLGHSHYVCDRVAAARPALPVGYVPMGVPLPPSIGRDAARAALGLPDDALILASFGHVNPFKRVEAVLRALRTLRAAHGDVRYVLVGSVSPNYDLRALVARMGLEQAVQITGYVERATFAMYVAAADICVNLRHPTAGETSASLLRLLGAARPTLVTATGSFAELPADVAAPVDPDRSEEALILAYCRLLHARPDLAAAMGANARAFVAREHTLDGAAAGYMRFLAQVHGWDEQPKQCAPLWELAADVAGDGEQGPGDGRRKEAGGQAATGSLSTTIATALAGMGATEDDHVLLNAVAQALRGLA